MGPLGISRTRQPPLGQRGYLASGAETCASPPEYRDLRWTLSHLKLNAQPRQEGRRNPREPTMRSR